MAAHMISLHYFQNSAGARDCEAAARQPFFFAPSRSVIICQNKNDAFREFFFKFAFIFVQAFFL